jgi:hypothetical protein
MEMGLPLTGKSLPPRVIPVFRFPSTAGCKRIVYFSETNRTI